MITLPFQGSEIFLDSYLHGQGKAPRYFRVRTSCITLIKYTLKVGSQGFEILNGLDYCYFSSEIAITQEGSSSTHVLLLWRNTLGLNYLKLIIPMGNITGIYKFPFSNQCKAERSESKCRAELYYYYYYKDYYYYYISLDKTMHQGEILDATDPPCSRRFWDLVSTKKTESQHIVCFSHCVILSSSLMA